MEGQSLFENVVLLAVVTASLVGVQLGVQSPFVFNIHRGRVFGGGDEVGEVAVAPAVEFKQTREDVQLGVLQRGFIDAKKGARSLVRAFQVGDENGALFVDFYFFEKIFGNGCDVRFSFVGQAGVDELRVAPPFIFRAAIFGLVVGPVPVPHKVKHLRRDGGAFVEVHFADSFIFFRVDFFFFWGGLRLVVAYQIFRLPAPRVHDLDIDFLVNVGRRTDIVDLSQDFDVDDMFCSCASSKNFIKWWHLLFCKSNFENRPISKILF